jgi:hypothetical protein
VTRRRSPDTCRGCAARATARVWSCPSM